jgi:phosphoserine phosphatase RsbU/P
MNYFRYLRLRLFEPGFMPTSKVARTAWYLLGLDLLLFALQKLLGLFKLSYGESLTGWVFFLSFGVVALFAILAYRWLKARLLWRLRNRLIVTYVFIGVIPAALLIVMALFTIYLFAGQFANFVVISELNSRLRSLETANTAVANELAMRLERGEKATAVSLDGLRRREPAWSRRYVCGWQNEKPLLLCGEKQESMPFSLPAFLKPPFTVVVQDQGKIYLRAATRLTVGSGNLTVISSDELDRKLLEQIAAELGEVTLYVSDPAMAPAAANTPPNKSAPLFATQDQKTKEEFSLRTSKGAVDMQSGKERLRPAFTTGNLSVSTGRFDREVDFPAPLPVVDWVTGEQRRAGAVLWVETRPSILYSRLFAAVPGDFAKGVEVILLLLAVGLGVILLPAALFIGTRLTRTVTGAVAQLYEATKHINRGDFSHRIPVTSTDQLATLANSFNSMTASIEKLVEEQKQKQRLENELAIAQEVQEQLFPQRISQLPSLEVYGFCRPARTVSGDYYDFLTLGPERLILAVGDISGKGISAALLMATIHSAVRAYSLEGIPVLREQVAVGATAGSGITAPALRGAEVSAATMLSLLNHQLYESTPSEKYATLFLGIYDGQQRKLTYSNAGHLPPIILGEDGSMRRLECGGTVIGLFNQVDYEEDCVPLRRGEIFLAYSDGVTEPENDFGEFGEHRLIELVRENRHLPLTRISEIVTAAVDDWIGANEQPDDVTLVLARSR